MSEPAISVRDLSKCYRLGTIGRHTLVDEAQYWWHRIRGRDPREHFRKIGHTATEARRVEAEREGSQDFWALKDVSFDVQPGEVVGIIGRNGAGKSTLLKLLTRITEPTSGEALLDGRVSSLLEVGTGFHPELTGRENIYMNGAILGMKTREIDAKLDEIIAFSEIEKFIDTPVKRYSSGMYVRLAFAVAAHLEPEILVVDEVLAVGDAEFQKKCLGKMGDVAQEGRTILFVSHNMPAVQNLCPRCLLMQNGRLVTDDRTPAVMKAYLNDKAPEGNARDLRDPHVKHSGSGEARIERGEILTVDGQPAASFPMGSGMRVRLHIRAATDIDRVGAMVAIIDSMGFRICRLDSIETADRSFSLHREREIAVDCVIPSMNLMPGVYGVNLLLTAATCRKFIDVVPQALSFDIVPADVYGTGRIPSSTTLYLPVRWECPE